MVTLAEVFTAKGVERGLLADTADELGDILDDTAREHNGMPLGGGLWGFTDGSFAVMQPFGMTCLRLHNGLPYGLASLSCMGVA